MLSREKIDSIFDTLANECVDKSTGGDSAVVMGVFNEDEEIGFHAVHGNMAAVVALITAMLKHIASEVEMPPFELLMSIVVAIEKDREEEKGELN